MVIFQRSHYLHIARIITQIEDKDNKLDVALLFDYELCELDSSFNSDLFLEHCGYKRPTIKE